MWHKQWIRQLHLRINLDLFAVVHFFFLLVCDDHNIQHFIISSEACHYAEPVHYTEAAGLCSTRAQRKKQTRKTLHFFYP